MKSNRGIQAAFAVVGFVVVAGASQAQTRIRTGPDKGKIGHPWANSTTQKDRLHQPIWHPAARQQGIDKAKAHRLALQRQHAAAARAHVRSSKANQFAGARNHVITPSHGPKHVVAKKWNHGQQVSAQRHAANAIRKAEKHEHRGNDTGHGRKHDDHNDHHKDWGKHK